MTIDKVIKLFYSNISEGYQSTVAQRSMTTIFGRKTSGVIEFPFRNLAAPGTVFTSALG